MNKSFIIDQACNNMRFDRWLRTKLGKIPQGLLEKCLRSGKIKINKKKVKSSFKIQTNDKVEIFNFIYKENKYQKKIKFNPSNQIIKTNENLIIDNNDNFVVLNKAQVFLFKGAQNQKNLIDIFAKSEIFKNTKPIQFIG